jgi:hypothetical protein
MERPNHFREFFIIFLQKDNLRESVAVSEIDEEYAAVIPDGINPTGKNNRLAIMFFPKFTTSFGS